MTAEKIRSDHANKGGSQGKASDPESKGKSWNGAGEAIGDGRRRKKKRAGERRAGEFFVKLISINDGGRRGRGARARRVEAPERGSCQRPEILVAIRESLHRSRPPISRRGGMIVDRGRVASAPLARRSLHVAPAILNVFLFRLWLD